MKNKIQQLTNSILGAIREEDEDSGKVEEWIESTNPWKEITEKGEASEEFLPPSPSLPKQVSRDLIDLHLESEADYSSGNSLSLGEFEGPIEVTIRAQDKMASISLSNIAQSLDSKLTLRGTSSDGSGLSNFELQIPVLGSVSAEVSKDVNFSFCISPLHSSGFKIDNMILFKKKIFLSFMKNRKQLVKWEAAFSG